MQFIYGHIDFRSNRYGTSVSSSFFLFNFTTTSLLNLLIAFALFWNQLSCLFWRRAKLVSPLVSLLISQLLFVSLHWTVCNEKAYRWFFCSKVCLQLLLIRVLKRVAWQLSCSPSGVQKFWTRTCFVWLHNRQSLALFSGTHSQSQCSPTRFSRDLSCL